MKLLLLSAAIIVLPVLEGCRTPMAPSADSSSASGQAPLSALAGTWKFSHVGQPTIADSNAPDPAAIARDQLRSAEISIQKGGAGAIKVGAQTRSFQLALLEETPLYIRAGVHSQPDGAYVYEKSSGLLMLSMPLQINETKGSMPAYFKRSRRTD